MSSDVNCHNHKAQQLTNSECNSVIVKLYSRRMLCRDGGVGRGGETSGLVLLDLV